MRACHATALAMLAVLACRPTSQRYLVTARPLNTGVTSPPLCVAVDPADPHGVWWWEPGASGCATRSTGPGVFPGDGAVVERTAAAIQVRFRIGLHGRPPFADVVLTVDRNEMQARASGARVPIARRNGLEMREEPPR
jgi:hypothetical protein